MRDMGKCRRANKVVGLAVYFKCNNPECRNLRRDIAGWLPEEEFQLSISRPDKSERQPRCKECRRNEFRPVKASQAPTPDPIFGVQGSLF